MSLKLDNDRETIGSLDLGSILGFHVSFWMRWDTESVGSIIVDYGALFKLYCYPAANNLRIRVYKDSQGYNQTVTRGGYTYTPGEWFFVNGYYDQSLTGEEVGVTLNDVQPYATGAFTGDLDSGMVDFSLGPFSSWPDVAIRDLAIWGGGKLDDNIVLSMYGDGVPCEYGPLLLAPQPRFYWPLTDAEVSVGIVPDLGDADIGAWYPTNTYDGDPPTMLLGPRGQTLNPPNMAALLAAQGDGGGPCHELADVLT